MKKITRCLAISALSLVAVSFVAGCGSTKEETTHTTTYVPEAPPAVVVNPAPVVMAPPPVTTSSTTVEKRSQSDTTELTPMGNSGDSSSVYHSETSTVGPQ
jgi:hypothetical protein